MADCASDDNSTLPLRKPTGADLRNLWIEHCKPRLTVEQILDAMRVPQLHFFACVATDPELYQLFHLRDTCRHEALDVENKSPADRSRALLDHTRAVRAIASQKAAMDAIAPEPKPLPEPDPQPETEDDRYCAAPARYHDENGLPINMQHPACVDAAMDAILDTRRRLESEARARLDEQQRQRAGHRPAQPQSGTNFERYTPELPADDPAPEIDREKFRKSFRRWFSRPEHASLPAPPPPAAKGRWPARSGRRLTL